MLKLAVLGFQEIVLRIIRSNLTPNTPVKIENSYDELPETFFLLMMRADMREKTKDLDKVIPIYSVVQSTHSVPHKVCQISRL